MNLPSITKLCIVATFFSGVSLYGMKYPSVNQEFQKLLEEDEKADSPGRVVIINGPSSSGKTLICRELKRRFDHAGFVSMDDSYTRAEANVACRGAKELIRKGLEEEHLVLLKRIGECARVTGIVVCDAVLLSQDYGDISSTFCQLLQKAGYEVTHVLVYCPLPVLLKQVIQRNVGKKDDTNARNVLDVALQFLHFYSLKQPTWKIDDYVLGDCIPRNVVFQQIGGACNVIQEKVAAQTSEFFRLESRKWLEDAPADLKAVCKLYSTIIFDRIFYNDAKHKFNDEIEKLQDLFY